MDVSEDITLEVEALEQHVDTTFDTIRKKLRKYDISGTQYEEEVFSIRRVPPSIWNTDPADAYEPQVISIGPYHPQTTKFDEMQDCKWWYMHKLLQRTTTTTGGNFDQLLERCIGEVKQAEVRARTYYKEKYVNHISSDDFVEMLVLDGCFIVELLVTTNDGWPENDPIHDVPWMFSCIWTDLLKLENQIPYFILEALSNIVEERNRLYKLASSFISNGLYLSATDPPKKKIHHLLHFCHILLRPQSLDRGDTFTSNNVDPGDASTTNNVDPEDASTSNNVDPGEASTSNNVDPGDASTSNSVNPADASTSNNVDSGDASTSSQRRPCLKSLLKSYTRRKSAKQKTSKLWIPCAVELREAGISFTSTTKEDKQNFLNVSFKDGVLHIPSLTFEDATNPIFRNLLAFEQFYPNQSCYFTAYQNFLDCLVNTSRDVTLLQQRGVIENLLGSEDEVAQVINQLGKEVILDEEDYLTDVFSDVNEYCQSMCNKHRAMCMRDYFSSPWSIISVIAALALLLMAFLQLLFAGLSYGKQ